MLLFRKGLRGKSVASAALKGAVEQIKKQGGGRIEGYPEDIEDRKASSTFLFNGPPSTFERLVRDECNAIRLGWSQVYLTHRMAWIHPDQAKAKKPIGLPPNNEAVPVFRQEADKRVFAEQE